MQSNTQHFRIFTFFLLVTVCIGPLWASVAYADEPTTHGRAAIKAAMEERGLEDLIGCELLYDRQDNPSFVIGYASNGYLIMDAKTGSFLEQCSGSSPYSDEAQKKYYGGFGCYAEDRGEGIVDPTTGEPLIGVPFLPATEISTANANREVTPLNPTTPSVLKTKSISSSTGQIKQIAFGNNAGGYANTCSAVAAGIALNYLDYSFDDAVVSPSHEHEKRSSVEYKSSLYFKATALHHYLVDNCTFAPWYPVDDFTIGLWRGRLASAMNVYLSGAPDRKNVGLQFSEHWGDTSNIAPAIDNNTPVLITVAWHEFEGGKYNLHTMVAYGYRTLSDGTTEVNLHSGWYDSDCNSSYAMDDIWAPASIATVSYTFALSDGWHCGKAGERKYYESGTYVTGWKMIDRKHYYFKSNGTPATGYLTIGDTRYYFDSDGALVSQSSTTSPWTGVEDLTEAEISRQYLEQAAIQSTVDEHSMSAALLNAQTLNPEIIGWLYVPGTSVSCAIGRHEGNDSWYLTHGAKNEDSTLGCAYMEEADDPSFQQPVTALYGHSSSNASLMFTGLHKFEKEDFFRSHEWFYVQTSDRLLTYRITEAAIYHSSHLATWAQEDNPELLQRHFNDYGSLDSNFLGFRRPFTLEAGRDRIVHLSTCTAPAIAEARWVVTGVLYKEEMTI